MLPNGPDYITFNFGIFGSSLKVKRDSDIKALNAREEMIGISKLNN